MVHFLAAVLLMVPTGAAPVPAGKSGDLPSEIPLPANTPLVVQLQGYDSVKSKVETFLAKAFPDQAERMKTQFAAFLESGLEGRKFTGLTKGGRIYFALTALKDLDAEESPIAFVVPVDDAKTFLDGFFPADKVTSREMHKMGIEKIVSEGGTYYVVKKADRVVLVENPQLAETMAGSFETIKTSTWDTDAAKLFFSSDLSVAVNVLSVNEMYADDIRNFRQLMTFVLEQGGGGQLEKQQLEQARIMIKGFFRALDDGRSFVAGAALKPEGVSLSIRGTFKAGSPSATFTGAEKQSSHEALGQMPGGHSVYLGSVAGPGLSDATAGLYREIMAGDDDEGGHAAIDAWTKIAQQAKSTRGSSEFNRNGITWIDHPDPKSYADGLATMYQKLGDGAIYQNVVLKNKPVVALKDQSVRNMTFHRIQLAFDYEKSTEKLPEAAREAAVQSMKKMLPSPISFWIGTDGKTILQVTAPDWTKARTLIDSAFESNSRIKDDASFAAMRKQLPDEVTTLVGLDTVKLTNFMSEYLGSMFRALGDVPFEIDFSKIKPIQAKPSYAGFALTLKGNAFVLDLFVPHESVHAAYRAIQPLLIEMP